jgi:hypothetical protein
VQQGGTQFLNWFHITGIKRGRDLSVLNTKEITEITALLHVKMIAEDVFQICLLLFLITGGG